MPNFAVPNLPHSQSPPSAVKHSQVVAQQASTVNGGCHFLWAFGWLLSLLAGFQMGAAIPSPCAYRRCTKCNPVCPSRTWQQQQHMGHWPKQNDPRLQRGTIEYAQAPRRTTCGALFSCGILDQPNAHLVEQQGAGRSKPHNRRATPHPFSETRAAPKAPADGWQRLHMARPHGRRSAQKRRKKMGSSVAYKTIGTRLSQKMEHEDAGGQAPNGCNAVGTGAGIPPPLLPPPPPCAGPAASRGWPDHRPHRGPGGPSPNARPTATHRLGPSSSVGRATRGEGDGLEGRALRLGLGPTISLGSGLGFGPGLAGEARPAKRCKMHRCIYKPTESTAQRTDSTTCSRALELRSAPSRPPRHETATSPFHRTPYSNSTCKPNRVVRGGARATCSAACTTRAHG